VVWAQNRECSGTASGACLSGVLFRGGGELKAAETFGEPVVMTETLV